MLIQVDPNAATVSAMTSPPPSSYSPAALGPGAQGSAGGNFPPGSNDLTTANSGLNPSTVGSNVLGSSAMAQTNQAMAAAANPAPVTGFFQSPAGPWVVGGALGLLFGYLWGKG